MLWQYKLKRERTGDRRESRRLIEFQNLGKEMTPRLKKINDLLLGQVKKKKQTPTVISKVKEVTHHVEEKDHQ